ncbi:hypothetical protein KKG90_06205 [Candidatus Bipolaricaulota bacterium]|nr:hypothetical protein [Candidatus Bipolaricaulota bacterium]
MMRWNKGKKEWLDRLQVDIILLLLGVIVAMVSVLFSGMTPGILAWRTIFLTTGTALLTTGFASLLYRILYLLPKERVSIKLWCERRLSNYGEDAYLTERAQRIDVLGVACRHFLETLAAPTSSLRERILHHGVRVRVLFVLPGSPYAQQRALEDGKVDVKDINKDLRTSLGLAKKIHHDLQNKIKGGVDRLRCGTLEIRVTGHCIYHSLTRLDDVIYWGLYTAHKPGSESPSLMIPSTVPSVHGDLTDHFTKLWSDAEKDGWVVRFMQGDLPIFNEKMEGYLNPPAAPEAD